MLMLMGTAALFGALDVLIELSVTREAYEPGQTLQDWCTIREQGTSIDPAVPSLSSSASLLARASMGPPAAAARSGRPEGRVSR